MADDPPVTGVTLDVNVLAGRSLVAKDGSGFLKLGKAKTSDPYVVVWYGKQKLADTKVETKTLDPVWNQTWQWKFDGRTFKASAELTFKIYDHDRGSADDPMGEVRLPVKSLLHGRESDKWYKVENCNGCSKCVSPLPCLHGLARLRPLLPPRVPPRPFAPSPPPPWMPTALAFDSLCVCSLAIATLCRTRSLQLGGTCALARARSATGELHLKITATARRALALKKKDALQLGALNQVLAIGLGWDMINGRKAIDLDSSCVAISFQGEVVKEECVYFAHLKSRSGAITHTGDEREGDEDLGEGDDEVGSVCSKLRSKLRRVSTRSNPIALPPRSSATS